MLFVFYFLEVTFWAIFSLTHKEEIVCPDRTHPMLYAESNYVCMSSFRSVATFFLSSFFFRQNDHICT